MRRKYRFRWAALAVLLGGLILGVAIACGGGTVVETVVVEKQVPVEKVVKETVVVEKQVPVEKVVQQTVVVKEQVPVEKIVKETVVVEKQVPVEKVVKETVVVEKQVEKVVKQTVTVKETVVVVETATPTPIPVKPGTKPVAVPAPKSGGGEVVVVVTGPLQGQVGLQQDQPSDGLKNWGVGETLFLINNKSGAPEPWLATDWSVTPDLKSGTVKLTDKSEFAALVDGQYKSFGKLTADDVAWSMNQANAATNPTSIHGQAGDFAGLWGEWKAVDDQTITFDFNNFDPTWTTNFTNISGQAFSPFSHKAEQEMGDDWVKDHTVASGPYLIKQWSDNDFVELVSTKSLGHPHWKLDAKTDMIRLQQAPESATRVAMMKTGEADAAQLNIKDVPQFTAGGFKALTNGNAVQLGVFFSGNLWQKTDPKTGQPLSRGTYVHNIAWLGNPDDADDMTTAQSIRYALAIAYDREAIAKQITGGLGWPVQVEYVSTRDSHWQDKWNYGYHPDEAAKIIRGEDPAHPIPNAKFVKDNVTAEQQKELNGNAFSVSLYAGPEFGGGLSITGEVTDAVAGYWQDLGLTVFSLKFDYATFRPTVVGRTNTHPWVTSCDLGKEANPWSAPKGAVETSLTRGGFACGYESPKIYDLFTQETKTPDEQARVDLVNQYVQYKYEQALSPGIVAVPNLEVINPNKIKSWEMSKTLFSFPTDFWNLELK